MITPLIEKELIAGRARFCTHMHSSTGASKIEIPDNNFAIVLEVIAFPFSDVSRSIKDANFDDMDQRSIHIVELTNQESGRVGFIYRNSMVKIIDGAGKIQSMANSPQVHFNTYLVRNKSFYCQVGTYEGVMNAIGVDVGTLQPKTQLPDPVKGYGNTAGLVVDIQNADGSFYSPCGSEGLPYAGAGVNLYYNQPFPNYSGTGTLNNKELNNIQTPVVQVNYVLLNTALLKNFQ